MYAFDAATGERRWQLRVDDYFFAQPVVADETVYAGSVGRYMYAIDAASGTRLWAHNTERIEDRVVYGAIHSAPAVVEDLLYFGSEDRKVYALASG